MSPGFANAVCLPFQFHKKDPLSRNNNGRDLSKLKVSLFPATGSATIEIEGSFFPQVNFKFQLASSLNLLPFFIPAFKATKDVDVEKGSFARNPFAIDFDKIKTFCNSFSTKGR